jgi:tryptophanyl-tRNA synthetase
VGDFGGRETEALQRALSDLLISELSPISREFQHLLTDTGHLDAILATGASKAKAIADPILADVYDLTGMSRRSGSAG